MDLYLGDCLEILPTIPAASVDAVIADPPYGTTACKWDAVIPFEPMWKELKRIIKPRGAIVLFGSQPFTSALIASNFADFRYSMVWDKIGTTGFVNAKKMPLRRHEDVSVFYSGLPTYNPQMEERGRPRHKGGSKVDNGCYANLRSAPAFNNSYYPTSVIPISNANKSNLSHPTQKPVALLEYLIRTYTNEGETVLDFTMGSGTAGVACVNTRRNFIGIEKDAGYFATAKQRIKEAAAPAPLFATAQER